MRQAWHPQLDLRLAPRTTHLYRTCPCLRRQGLQPQSLGSRLHVVFVKASDLHWNCLRRLPHLGHCAQLHRCRHAPSVPTAGAASGNPLVPTPPFIGSPPSVGTSAASSSSCTQSISSFSPGHLDPSSTWEIIWALLQADSRPASDVANVLIQLLQQQQGEPSAMIPTAGLLASVNGGPFESAFGGIEQPNASAPAVSGESGGESGSDIGGRDSKRARTHE